MSLGGNLAFLVAARHPDLVHGLVVAEASPEADQNGASTAEIRQWLEGWPTPFPSREAAVTFFKGTSQYANAWADGLEHREGGWWPRFDTEVMVRTLHDCVRRDYWEEWKRIRCPTMVVRAGEGFFQADILRAMARRLPGAWLVEIPGATHDLHLDHPVEWRDAVAGFLATLRPTSHARWSHGGAVA